MLQKENSNVLRLDLRSQTKRRENILKALVIHLKGNDGSMRLCGSYYVREVMGFLDNILKLGLRI